MATQVKDRDGGLCLFGIVALALWAVRIVGLIFAPTWTDQLAWLNVFFVVVMLMMLGAFSWYVGSGDSSATFLVTAGIATILSATAAYNGFSSGFPGIWQVWLVPVAQVVLFAIFVWKEFGAMEFP